MVSLAGNVRAKIRVGECEIFRDNFLGKVKRREQIVLCV